MKQDYTMYIYRADRRCRTGERLFSTTVWRHRDEAGMHREATGLRDLYPAAGWRFEWFPRIGYALVDACEPPAEYDHACPGV
jgi:hypothetical protein